MAPKNRTPARYIEQLQGREPDESGNYKEEELFPCSCLIYEAWELKSNLLSRKGTGL